MDLLPSNLVLRNLCDDYLQERSHRAVTDDEVLCSLHGEKLKLFCLEDKQLACLVCRDSKKHADHKFCPVDEAAQDLKVEPDDIISAFCAVIASTDTLVCSVCIGMKDKHKSKEQAK